jgi:hypothetical protein
MDGPRQASRPAAAAATVRAMASRWEPFTADELALIGDALVIAHRPGEFEEEPDSDDLVVVIDLIDEMQRRGDEELEDFGALPGLQELARRASRAD